jgi:hypothetical protein
MIEAKPGHHDVSYNILSIFPGEIPAISCNCMERKRKRKLKSTMLYRLSYKANLERTMQCMM